MYPFRLPEPFDRLARWLEADARRRELVTLALGEPDRRLGGDDDVARELSHLGATPELFPVLWNGGDALHYGLLVHDLELPPMFVSRAPSDSCGPLWLADDARSGIARLLAVTLRDRELDWGESARGGDDLLAECLADTHAAVREISSLLAIAPADDVGDLSEGARSTRPPVPTVPEGWYFDVCNDDVGALAPIETFDPSYTPPDHATLFDLEHEVRTVESFLTRGFPGSALGLARNLFHELRTQPGHGEVGARLMRRSYEALGRDFLAQRIDAYLVDPARHR